MSRLCITGFGIVSSIGIGKEETLRSLLDERTGLGRVKYLKTMHDEFPVGEVHLSNEEMASSLGIPSGQPMTRTALMGMMALREALDDSGIQAFKRVSFVSATTVGGMDKSEQYYLDFLDNDSRNAYIATHDCGACSEMIADYFGAPSSITTLSTACSSAANAVIYGARQIEQGICDIAVVGGSECITKFHLNGFNSLMILDRELCRPFDAARAGINLGEGAAYIVLENEEHALMRGAKVYAYLSGYGNACDAYHQTASSPNGDGAFLAMQKALQMAGVESSEIGYVNAHGTGTRDNDSSESNAMRRLFGDDIPPVSSTKAFTGHTTSASGSIELAICLLAMQNRFIPANLRWQSGDGCIVPVKTTLRDADLHHVLCNSFGFGGNDTSLLISKPSGTIQTLSAEPTAYHNHSNTEAFIYAASQISLQKPLSEEWMDEPLPINEGYNRALEPDYKQYIQPLEARRMGKLMKRAVAVCSDIISKTQALLSGLMANCQQPTAFMPDAIISGTGLGCVEYTELFLDPLCRQGESLLKPTYFMQSTHNTVSSSLAIRLKCHGYNATYSHKSISFDSALEDAIMQISSGSLSTAMVCGFDEVTPSYYGLLKKIGFLGQPGEPSGECAAAFLLGGAALHGSPLRPAKGNILCRIAGHKMLYCPTDEELSEEVGKLHDRTKAVGSQAVMLGYNGSEVVDGRYDALLAGPLRGCVPLHYKHLFGECYSAPAMGLYAAACCLHRGVVPAFMRHEGGDNLPVDNILIVNYDDRKNCAITLLCSN